MVNHYIVIAEEGDLIGEKKLLSQYIAGEWKGNQWLTPDGEEWQVIITGVGAVNVIRALQDLPRESVVLNIGYAGSSNFEIGSAVMVEEVRLNHPNCSYPEPVMKLNILPKEYRRQVEGKTSICYSGADFVLASDYKDCAFDMELAYIAAMGFKTCYALKIVSDNLSLHDYRKVAAGVQ